MRSLLLQLLLGFPAHAEPYQLHALMHHEPFGERAHVEDFVIDGAFETDAQGQPVRWDFSFNGRPISLLQDDAYGCDQPFRVCTDIYQDGVYFFRYATSAASETKLDIRCHERFLLCGLRGYHGTGVPELTLVHSAMVPVPAIVWMFALSRLWALWKRQGHANSVGTCTRKPPLTNAWDYPT